MPWSSFAEGNDGEAERALVPFCTSTPSYTALALGLNWAGGAEERPVSAAASDPPSLPFLSSATSLRRKSRLKSYS